MLIALTIILVIFAIGNAIRINDILTMFVTFLGIILIFIVAILKSDKKGKRESQQAQPTAQQNSPFDERIYEKKRLMTFTEKQFHEAIKKAIPENYILLPQVNLATIIRRVDEHTYQNELYRNIDFAIFNSEYMPLLLIEINDNTHNEIDRRERDRKVKEICQCAQLPIITFWTEYGINEEYIYKTIHKYI